MHSIRAVLSCRNCLQDPFAQKEEYNDSWFDKFMVDYFAKQMSKQLGGEAVNPPHCSNPHRLTFTAPDQSSRLAGSLHHF